MRPLLSLLLLFLPVAALAADTPIYRVTVVQRSLPAVNYGHRSAPTRIDFRGTVLTPDARGGAVVEAKPGAVLIQAKFKGLGNPAQFGAQYLTYVLWAISPEGQPERLGEIVTNGHNDGKLEVSTSLQTFGLLVTAEPYFAVSKPSPVVVMENVLRPDTIGASEPISAKYELLQRPENYEVTLPAAPTSGPLVSQKEYEALLALYQAQNAIQIAKAEGDDQFAHDTLSRAESLEKEAQDIPHRGDNRDKIVTLARQAAQTAEDARSIAAHKRGGSQ